MTELAVIVTGAVGVAGIVGSLAAVWMTGKVQTANLRLSISSEHERARIAEKRRVYARAIASFAAFPMLMITSLDGEDVVERAYEEMLNAIAEVVLIAPQEVADPADAVMDEFLAISRKFRRIIEEDLSKGAVDPDLVIDLLIERELMEALPQLGETVDKLTNAMRADLGEETLKDDAEPG